MENSGIVFIAAEQIYQHPDNPRKDLGDLSELSESIKKKGIMQNLTVILGHWDENRAWFEDGYTLIIGHRRFAAGKMADVAEFPCRIVTDMSQKDQVSTMLEENMQRNDLTIWEQANGFQMMLDLGDTEEQIAEKTGFSKTTIRHRLNIAKLDQAVLKKKEQDEGFQMTLNDLYALEKVDDIKIRNKILREATSSRDLVWKAQNAVNEAEREKKVKAISKLLKDAGIKEAPKTAANEMYTGKWETVKEYNLEKEVPKKLSLPKGEKDTDKLYYLQYFRSVRVIKKATKKPESKADKERKQRENDKKQIKAKMKELNARKKDFISSIISGKIAPIKEVQEVQDAIWSELVNMESYISSTSLRSFFTGKYDYNCTAEEKEDADNKIRQLSALLQMMISLSYSMENVGDIYDWKGCFNADRADKLKKAYAILERYGWTFEDEEKQLLDGTHELYVKEKKD